MQPTVCTTVSHFSQSYCQIQIIKKLFLVVADVGGLLGFFLGCSILSLIEIVYFTFEMCISRLKYYIVAHGERRRYKKPLKVEQQQQQQQQKQQWLAQDKISDFFFFVVFCQTPLTFWMRSDVSKLFPKVS